jgi:hypothetical protein
LARHARKRRPGATTSRPPRAGTRPSRDAGAVNGRAEAAPRDEVAPPDAVAPRELPRETMARGYARGRERDEAAREALVPLAPGERPWPIAVSAILAALFAVANVVLLLTGYEVDGKRPIASGLIFAGVMLAAAVGMWQLRYWAVLGWQVLLGVTCLGALLSLLRAENVQGVALSVVVLAITGPLFYLLIRQMARIKMPARPARRTDA